MGVRVVAIAEVWVVAVDPAQVGRGGRFLALGKAPFRVLSGVGVQVESCLEMGQRLVIGLLGHA
jgi:hypothetical protein